MIMQDRIANALLLSSSFIDNLGLLNGKMGISIFFFHLAKQTGNKVFERYAEELIDELYDEISVSTPLDFTDGLAGIGWGIEYLAQNNFIEADTDEVLLEFDNALLPLIEKPDLKLIDAIGFGFYFLKRHQSSERYLHVLDILVTVIDKHMNSISGDVKALSDFSESKSAEFLLLLWFVVELRKMEYKYHGNKELLITFLSKLPDLKNNNISPLVKLFLKTILFRGLRALDTNKEEYSCILKVYNEIEIGSPSSLLQEVELKYKNDVAVRSLMLLSFTYLANQDKDSLYKDEVDFWYNENCKLFDTGILSKINLTPSTHDLGILNGVAGLGLLGIHIPYN